MDLAGTGPIVVKPVMYNKNVVFQSDVFANQYNGSIQVVPQEAVTTLLIITRAFRWKEQKFSTSSSTCFHAKGLVEREQSILKNFHKKSPKWGTVWAGICARGADLTRWCTGVQTKKERFTREWTNMDDNESCREGYDDNCVTRDKERSSQVNKYFSNPLKTFRIQNGKMAHLPSMWTSHNAATEKTV